MKSNTSLKLMQEADAQIFQDTMVRLIANDLYKSYLLSEIDEKKKRPNYDPDSYIFDLDAVILESFGFNAELIDDEIGYWYYRQIQEAIESPQMIKSDYINSSALKIFSELEELSKIENTDLGAILRERLGIERKNCTG